MYCAISWNMQTGWLLRKKFLEALWSETYVNPEGIRKYILEIRKVLGRPAPATIIHRNVTKAGLSVHRQGGRRADVHAIPRCQQSRREYSGP